MHALSVARNRPHVRDVFLPKEHGSWFLAAEPLAFGLMVACSPGGVALAIAAAAIFFLRRPLKAIGRDPARAAWGPATLLTACAGAGFIITVILSGWRPVLWLIPAAPLGALFLYWDHQNESRATAAEATACSIFALLPAAMAAQAGLPATTAGALGILMLARSLPSVLTIRTYLRNRKGRLTSPWPAVITTALSVTLVILLVAQDLAPRIAAGLVVFSSLRVLLLLPTFAPNWPARRIGMAEAIFGLVYVLANATAW